MAALRSAASKESEKTKRKNFLGDGSRKLTTSTSCRCSRIIVRRLIRPKQEGVYFLPLAGLRPWQRSSSSGLREGLRTSSSDLCSISGLSHCDFFVSLWWKNFRFRSLSKCAVHPEGKSSNPRSSAPASPLKPRQSSAPLIFYQHSSVHRLMANTFFSLLSAAIAAYSFSRALPPRTFSTPPRSREPQSPATLQRLRHLVPPPSQLFANAASSSSLHSAIDFGCSPRISAKTSSSHILS